MSVADITMDVVADPALLGGIRGLVRAYLCESGFPEARVEEAVLGVDEACTNAIRHACEDRSDTFRLCLQRSDTWVEIHIEDSGDPVSEEALDHAVEAGCPDAESVKPGGLGLRLIHEVFDEVEFCPGHPLGKCLTMRLRRVEDGAV